MMIFKKVPLPPSSNNQYISILRHGKIIRASSKELTTFKKNMEWYWIEHNNQLKIAREIFSGLPLSIHVDFFFEKSRLISKKGHLKRLDVSNRLKAIHDALASALLIDDCFFVRISAEKYAVSNKQEECAMITIEAHEFVELEKSC